MRKRSPSFIDWSKHIFKVKDLIVGHLPDGRDTPILRVKSHELGVSTKTLLSFLPEELRKIPVAWIVKDYSDYYVMSNCDWHVEIDYLCGVGCDGRPRIERRMRREGVKYGPYKSLVSAVKKVRALA